MMLDTRGARGAGRRWLYALVLICLVGGAVAYATTAGSAAAITTAKPSKFRSAVAARLAAEGLNYLWVACVRSGRRFEGVPVVRCNVDFGEPHIVAYCSVSRNGRLLTSEDNAAIPCRHDDSGWSDPVVTYR